MNEIPADLVTGSLPLTADSVEPHVGEEFVFGRPPNPDGAPAGVACMKLVSLHRRLAGLFKRSEPRQRSLAYLQGLLGADDAIGAN